MIYSWVLQYNQISEINHKDFELMVRLDDEAANSVGVDINVEMLRSARWVQIMLSVYSSILIELSRVYLQLR